MRCSDDSSDSRRRIHRRDGSGPVSEVKNGVRRAAAGARAQRVVAGARRAVGHGCEAVAGGIGMIKMMRLDLNWVREDVALQVKEAEGEHCVGERAQVRPVGY